jgi:hypothetical protein
MTEQTLAIVKSMTSNLIPPDNKIPYSGWSSPEPVATLSAGASPPPRAKAYESIEPMN